MCRTRRPHEAGQSVDRSVKGAAVAEAQPHRQRLCPRTSCTVLLSRTPCPRRPVLALEQTARL